MGEGDHEGEVREEGLWIIIPKFHVRVVEEAFEDCAGDIGGLIASAEEEGDEGENHFLAEFFVEEEHTEHNSNGNETEDGHGIFYDF